MDDASYSARLLRANDTNPRLPSRQDCAAIAGAIGPSAKPDDARQPDANSAPLHTVLDCDPVETPGTAPAKSPATQLVQSWLIEALKLLKQLFPEMEPSVGIFLRDRLIEIEAPEHILQDSIHEYLSHGDAYLKSGKLLAIIERRMVDHCRALQAAEEQRRKDSERAAERELDQWWEEAERAVRSLDPAELSELQQRFLRSRSDHMRRLNERIFAKGMLGRNFVGWVRKGGW
jgi:hypothetical protein